MSEHEKIDYVELPASDLTKVKRFFAQAFDWQFEDFGDSYTAFYNQGLDGGFYQTDMKSTSADGAALVIFFSDDLEATEEKIKNAGGEIVRATFSFPGGRRFHFTDPCGNEYAVWTKVAA